MIDMCLNINYFPFRHTFLPDSTHPYPVLTHLFPASEHLFPTTTHLKSLRSPYTQVLPLKGSVWIYLDN